MRDAPRITVPPEPRHLDHPDSGRRLGMDELRTFLEAVRQRGLVAGRLRGLFNITIGRKITKSDGTLVSAGVTWRELASLLKLVRYEKELVAEVGANPEELAPRDRQRFWYTAIAI